MRNRRGLRAARDQLHNVDAKGIAESYDRQHLHLSGAALDPAHSRP